MSYFVTNHHNGIWITTKYIMKSSRGLVVVHIPQETKYVRCGLGRGTVEQLILVGNFLGLSESGPIRDEIF